MSSVSTAPYSSTPRISPPPSFHPSSKITSPPSRISGSPSAIPLPPAPLPNNLTPSLNDNSIEICGADKKICPHCPRAFVNWSKVNASCVKIDAITLTHKSCTTRFIPFEADAVVCVGASSSQLTPLHVRKQTFCSDDTINDDRILVEINDGSVQTAVQGSNLLSIAIQTDTFACNPSFFSMAEGELSKVCVYDVRNPAYIEMV